MNVADLKLKEPDASGNAVIYFYGRKLPEYAVYQTSERVAVHFADASDKADEQRQALAQLAPLRGELNGLIDSWREAPDRRAAWGFVRLPNNGPKLRKRADRYDRRVADAMIVAFEGDLTGAGAVLQDIKEEVLDERVGWARFEYLLTAIGVALGFILFSSLVAGLAVSGTCSLGRNPFCFTNANDMWRGAMAGALGSFFSIALTIRGRTVLPDLNRTANLMDAALRIAIGVIAGVVLVALVLSNFVRLSIGDSSPQHANDLYIGITGFIGGFAERLVPDLLAKTDARTGEKPVLRRPEPNIETKSEKQKVKVVVAQRGQALFEDDSTTDAPADDAHEDSCSADVEIPEEKITTDDNLPAASGGVARSVVAFLP